MDFLKRLNLRINNQNGYINIGRKKKNRGLDMGAKWFRRGHGGKNSGRRRHPPKNDTYKLNNNNKALPVAA